MFGLGPWRPQPPLLTSLVGGSPCCTAAGSILAMSGGLVRTCCRRSASDSV